MNNRMKIFGYFISIIAVTQALFVSCGKNGGEPIEGKGLVSITFEGQSAAVINPYEGRGIRITAKSADVVIHSTVPNEITYLLSGSTAEGSLKIYSDAKFELEMNGVHLINSDDPAIHIRSGKSATVTLVGGTSSKLTGGVTFVSEGGGEDVKAAFFSEGQLVFSGTGSLVVAGRYRHAICSDDYIRVDGGTITVSQAEKDGLHANDYVEINGGAVEIISAGDGIESEGSVTLSGGSVKITTTASKSHGIKSAGNMTVNTAGDVDIQVKGAASKAFNCGGDLSILQGNLNLITSGNAIYDSGESGISSAAGIKCDGNLTIGGGHLVINSSGSGGKGINVVGNMILERGQIAVTTTGEVFKYGDDDAAAKAVTCDGDVRIDDGAVTIKTSGRKAEGLESKAHLIVHGGVTEVEAYDDAVKAAESITINGGSLYCFSETKDGVYSKGTLNITGGTVVAVGSTGSEGGFDCVGTFKITGGTLVGTGGTTSIPASGVSTQYSLLYSSGSGMERNTFFNITSSDGKHVMTYLLPSTLSPATLLFSSPELKNNESYTISSGGSITGGTSFHGLYNGATYTGGSSLSTFTIASMITIIKYY